MGIFSKFGQKAAEEAEAQRQRVDEMIAAGKAKEGSLKLDEIEANQKVRSAFKEKESEVDSQDTKEIGSQPEHEGDSEPTEQSGQPDSEEQPESTTGSGRREKADVSEDPDPDAISGEDKETEETAEVAEDLRMSLAGKFIDAAAKILFGEATPADYQDLAGMIAAREAVEAAFAEGELKGRNAQIEERLVESRIGVPDLGGAPVNTSRRPGNSIFDLAVLAR